MKISINESKQPVFKSGLTINILKDFRNFNVKEAEADFAKVGVDANFNGNKSVGACCVISSNILDEVSAKYNLPFNAMPPSIRTFKPKDLIDEYNQLPEAMCITDTKRVLKNDYPFVGRSIFFRDYKSILYTNFINTFDYLNKIRSSSHFLVTILHEWFHNIHLDLIFQEHGYEGDCPVLHDKYYKPDADGLEVIEDLTENYNIYPKTREYLKKYLGSYSIMEGSMMEVFAELMTKITTQSIDKKLNVIKNPLDNLPKDLPKYITNFIEQTLKI